ncbi:MAG: hypothetical protein IPH44_27005 [Myxococcales bacterium]|jgi:hypothetical protein|nr:hypothetical protein [Myxococcales bacterium]MBK7196353.1 hypothetical protein [Myxococcales bacterium]MBP6845947.1 hypothetical protein [Kofleriaceae bacterium]
MGKQARARRARRDGEVAPAAPPAKAAPPPWWHSRWRVALASVCVLVMIVSAAAMLTP